MRRGGFTFIELLLAAAVLATISFGALIGVTHLAKFADKQAEILVADGYCWDVIWKLFNQDLSDGTGNAVMDVSAFTENGQPTITMEYEVEERALPALYRADAKPVCYVTISNALTSAREVDTHGLFLSVNLEWGPRNARSILTPRRGMAAGTTVYDHPIRVYRSFLNRQESKEVEL